MPQKSRNRRGKQSATKPLDAPKFSYTSICCGAPAIKPACVKQPKDAKEPQGLGHWSCTNCGKGCKVNRDKKATNTPAPQVEAESLLETQ